MVLRFGGFYRRIYSDHRRSVGYSRCRILLDENGAKFEKTELVRDFNVRPDRQFVHPLGDGKMK